MGSQYIYILIALMLLSTFMLIKNNILDNQLTAVIQSQEYYNAISLAQALIDDAWLMSYADLNNLNNLTRTVNWAGVNFTVTTTISNYSYHGENYKKLDINIVSTEYNVTFNTNFVYADIK